MNKLFKVFILLVIGSTAIAQQNKEEFVEGEIYLRLKPTFRTKIVKKSDAVNINLELLNVSRAINAQNGKIEKAKSPFYSAKSDKLRQTYRLKINANTDIEKLIERLKNDPSVELVERVALRKTIAVPTDTSYVKQYHLNKIKAAEAWDVNPGTAVIKVAVVDNAIEINHPDLIDNMLPGFDLGDNDADASPPNASFSHGTHVAGIVAATTNNVRGIASASNNRVKVIPIKATPNSGNPDGIYFGFEGIVWAVDNGADIVSLSWGGGGFSQSEQDVIDYAYENGVMVIAAAGNENNNLLQYPAAYAHVVSVASLDSTDSRSSFSSYGNTVDIAAPGRGILSTIPFNSYAYFNGTSMATPLVASCAGYLLSCFPTLTIDSLESLIKSTADNIDAQNPAFVGQLGAGRINLLKAVACKEYNLFNQSIDLIGGKYICPGDSTQLSISSVGLETFEWFKNNQFFGNGSSIFTKEPGEYYLKRSSGLCTLVSEKFNINANNIQSVSPVAEDLRLFYCSGPDSALIATPVFCTNYGPSVFIYTGTPVGYDGFSQSDDSPFLQVEGIAGLIDSISISITWQKKDGGNHLNCDLADAGAIPFNEEVSFKIVSPEGITLALVNEGTYARGSTTSGVVTTVFSQGLAPIASGALPISGVFGAADNLNTFKNTIPIGQWTLIAEDNSFLDPLCVLGFSVNIKTQQSMLKPSVKWYDSSNQFVFAGDSLSVDKNQAGTFEYFVTQKCEGQCESTPIKVKALVKPIPEILAFQRPSSTLTTAQILEIRNAQTHHYSISSDNLYTVYGINQAGQSYSYQISNQAPSPTPLTICGVKDYLLFGLGCSGNISWSTGETAGCIRITNFTTPFTITATCVQSWPNCQPMANIPFQIKPPNTNLTLSGVSPVNNVQDFYGKKITSAQLVESEGNINYTGQDFILLEPGFEVEPSAVFKASIGNCTQP